MRTSLIQHLIAGLVLLNTCICHFSSSVHGIDGTDPFLTKYCIDCHSDAEASGEREFSTLNLKQNSLEMQIRLQEVIDQLTLATMPPEDANQPSEQARLEAINRLTKTLADMRAKSRSTGGQTVFRRLTRREYQNTISDLLGINMLMFDPTIEFPADNLNGSFDNVGHTLVTSGFLLEKYLEAADASVEKAFEQLKESAPQSWVFKDYFYQQAELRIAHDLAFKHRYLVLYDHRHNDKPEGAYGHLDDLAKGVPSDGVYEVRVHAQALHRDTPYSQAAIQMDTSEPFRMGVRPGNTAIGDMVHTQPIEPLMGETVIEDNTLKWYTFQIPLDKGHGPRFTFENGAHSTRGASGRVFRIHRDLIPEEHRDKKTIVLQRNWLLKEGLIPQIRIHEVRLHGPLPDPNKTKRRLNLLGGDEFQSEQVSELVASFARRAFRRPVADEEVENLMRIFESRVADGHSELQAYKDTLKAVLCSPSFLYFSPSPSAAETNDESGQHALAERLAYFLTSSMPDERLSSLADRDLLQADKLKEEAVRLLTGKNSQRFVADFMDSWLGLRMLGTMPPDPEDYNVYYAASLEEEMKRESHLFMMDLINRNGSAMEFLQATHSFANRDLAKLYGVAEQIPVEQAGEFHRVEFTDPKRGGLLGQASVLTVSANGVETSPVVRGVWVSEKIMGISPPLPPDDVPDIDPDVRGATTIREQLAKHRELATCNQCHRKIDPYGFALEGFDPIGRLRTFYDAQRKQPIDTSGELPGNKSFSGVSELKAHLIDQKEFFLRTLTSSLLIHALGREMESSDRAEIDAILASVSEQEFGMQDLIIAVILSDLFQH